jgi:hypothetical protein
MEVGDQAGYWKGARRYETIGFLRCLRFGNHRLLITDY